MTPPKAPDPQDGTSPSAALSCADAPTITTIKRRADFLRAARADKQGTKSMLVQGRIRAPGEPVIRLGFTCSKKVGNAVARNRAKRRLRAAAREVVAELGRPGWDYVLIGKRDVTAERPYDALKSDLAYALHQLHGRAE
ncbi:ribonuclease P protein component [Roseivivax sp. THAF30]|uniref:ribonuclease P protein component n=1 Tax=Roseivivax sp. THAF30 TaxID=2587852 RepID=UPI0012682FAF|nr:ribonuclease P protein component [Roseivivax sp. THAF30]QFT64593.1 Ribonuclease P protein component [Roseivivax sp. THAF30]